MTRAPFSLRSWLGRSRRRAPRKLGPRGYRRPILERLEDRTVPSTFDIFSRTALYQAAPGVANRLTLSQVGNALVLSDAAELIALGPTARAVGCLGNGTHTILCPASVLTGAILSTTDGRDSVTILPLGLTVPTTVRNPGGSTDLTLDDSGDTRPQTATLTGTALTGLGSAGVGFVGAELHSLTVNGGSGGNTFLVLDTPASSALHSGRGADAVFVTGTTGALTIDGGGSSDTVVLGFNPVLGQYTTLAGLRGAVGVADAGGLANLFVEDPSDTAPRTATLDAAHVTGLSPAAITFQNLSGLTIDGGSGGNSFLVSDTGAGYVTRLNSGPKVDSVLVTGTTGPLAINGVDSRDASNNEKADSVTLGGFDAVHGRYTTLDGLRGPVSVTSSAGFVGLALEDPLSTAARQVTFSNDGATGSITGAAPAAVTYTTPNMVFLGFAAGGGGNTLTVANTINNPAAGGSFLGTLLLTGAAGDAVNVRGTAGPVVISGQGGRDQVTLGSLAPVPGGTLAGIQGAVIVGNTGPLTDLVADDSGDGTGRTATLSGAALTGLAPAAVNFSASALHSLTVLGSGGGNTFTVQDTPAPTALFSGAGNDAVNVTATTGPLTIQGVAGRDRVTLGSLAPAAGGTAANLKGAVSVGNAAGLTDLLVDDGGAAFNPTAVVAAGSLTGLAPAPITFAPGQLASLTIDGGLVPLVAQQSPGTYTATVAGTFTAAHDRDVYAFDVPAAGYFAVNLTPRNGSAVAGHATLYEGAGFLGPDGGGPGGGLVADTGDRALTAPQVLYQYLLPGRYSLAVSPAGSATGDYNLTVTFATNPANPFGAGAQARLLLPSSVGNTLATALPVTLAPGVLTALGGMIQPGGVNLFAVQLPAGARFRADLTALQQQFPNPVLSTGQIRVFDSGGNPVASSIPFFFGPVVGFTVPATGTYYVGVSDSSNSAYDPRLAGSGGGTTTGHYELNLLLGTGPDLTGVSLQAPLAEAFWGGTLTITPKTQNRGLFDSGPFQVEIRLSTTPSVTDSSYLVQTVPFPQGLSAGLAAWGSFTLTLPGSPFSPPPGFAGATQVYLGLRIVPTDPTENNAGNDNNQGLGIDVLPVQILLPFTEAEPNDTPKQALPISPDAAVRGALSGAGDVDYYAITVPPGVGGQLRVQVSAAAGTSLDPSVSLYGPGPDYSLLAASDDVAPSDHLLVSSSGFGPAGQSGLLTEHLRAVDPGSPQSNYQSATPQTYYLAVSASHTGAGAYFLITQFVPDNGGTVGNHPVAVAAGDFNGDGIPDLAVSNASDNTISILLGAGDGTFRQASTYSVGNGPAAIVAADFNGDHLLDLAVADTYSGDVCVFQGFGNGTFALASQFVVGVRPVDVLAADFNGDGHADLAVSDVFLGWVVVFDGLGNFGFRPPRTGQVIPLNGALGTLVAGDFNGDHVLDLAAADTDHNSVAVILGSGSGDGTFQAPRRVTVDKSPRAVAVGDFNGDGISDLATANLSPDPAHGSVSVLLGQSDGTFTVAPPVPVDSGPISITAGDLNGDGLTDLVTTNTASGNLSILLGRKGAGGKPSGTFAPQERLPVGFGPAQTVIGDFNHDGRMDLATTDFQSNSVSALLGLGDGTFQDNVIGVGNRPQAVVVGDFNGDGVPDAVTANYGSGDLSLLRGTGTLTFQPEARIPLPAGQQPVALATGDFNHDGRADLAVATQGAPGVSILLGVGDGTFRAGGEYPAGQLPSAVVVGDFNRDGFDDLAVADFQAGAVWVWVGTKNGGFIPLGTFPTGGAGPRALVLADFTGDGVADLAVADQNSNEVTVLPGRANGSFGTPLHAPLGAAKQPVALVAGDFNGDGHPDLATANGGSGDVTVLLSDGRGGFLSPTTAAVGPNPTAITAADMDGDGRLDLMVSAAGAFAVSTLLGDPSHPGQFLAPHTTVNAGQLAALAPIQLTGLPQPAVVAINGQFDFAYLFLTTGGRGNATMSAAVNSEKPFRAAPLVGDVNGDRVPDAVSVSRSGAILFRAGQATPGQPITYAAPVVVNPDPAYHAQAVAVVRRKGALPLLAAIDSGGNTVSLYEQTAGGDWQRLPQTLDTGLTPSTLAAADLNGDGSDDLVVGNLQSSTVQIFLADPAGGFHPQGAAIRTGFDTNFVLPADVNGDGAPDILAVNGGSNDVAVLLNDGTGTFGAPTRFQAGAGPYFSNFRVVAFFGAIGLGSSDESTQVVAADFNGDAAPDLAVIDSASHTFTVLPGKGSGSFGNAQVYQLDGRPLAIAASPFTAGGPENLVILEQARDGTYELAVFLGDGHGQFTRLAVPASQANLLAAVNLPDGLTFKDVNGDGTPDLLVGDEFGDVLTLLGQGDGTFQPFQPITPHVSLAVPAPDTFVLGNTTANTVEVRNAAGRLLFSQTQEAGILAPGMVRAADVGGGMQALVVANSGANSVRVYLGRGGLFDPATARDYPAGDDPVGVTIADVNGDGVPDVLVANRGSNDVSILLGQGQGSGWTLAVGPRLQTNGRGPVAVTVQDVTGLNADGTPTGRPDGIPDLVVSNSLSNTASVLPGVGGGFFKDQSAVLFDTGASPRQVLLGDFNGDGQLDLVSVNAGSNDLTFFGHADFAAGGNAGVSIPSGGTVPLAAVAFSVGGREGLIIANSGDGTLALLAGDASGLALLRTVADQLHPTDLALADLTANEVGVYVANEGAGLAARVSFALDFGVPVPSLGEPGEARSVALLLPIEESTLAIIATLLPAEVAPPAAGGPAPAGEATPPPAFQIGLDALVGGGAVAHRAVGESRAAAALDVLLAAVTHAWRETFAQDGGLPLPVRLVVRTGLEALQSAVAIPGAVAATLGTPDLPWQQVVEDVREALLRAGRSLLSVPQRPAPAPPAPQPAPPEEVEAPAAPAGPEAVEVLLPGPGEDVGPTVAADRPAEEAPDSTAELRARGACHPWHTAFLMLVVVPLTVAPRARGACHRARGTGSRGTQRPAP
jgi:hypothetical protein